LAWSGPGSYILVCVQIWVGLGADHVLKIQIKTELDLVLARFESNTCFGLRRAINLSKVLLRYQKKKKKTCFGLHGFIIYHNTFLTQNILKEYLVRCLLVNGW
jgi:hypothetical protein